MLRAIYRTAIDEGAIKEIPFGIKVPRIDLKTDRQAWTPSMVRRLLDTTAELDEGMSRLARFLVVTGCRPVEALRLRWADVQQVPTPCIHIAGKGMRRRSLPLTGDLARLIESIERAGEHVFGLDDGRSEIGARRLFWPQKRWEQICAAADVPSAAYDLRHTFITDMVASGIPMAQIAHWCDNSVRVIEERYSHLAPEHLAEIASRADRHSASPSGTSTPKTTPTFEATNGKT